MINSADFRDKFLASLTIGYDWRTARHFAELEVAGEAQTSDKFRISGLSDYNISEDFRTQYISQCTLRVDSGGIYLSLDPYTEGSPSDNDNYTFTGTEIRAI